MISAKSELFEMSFVDKNSTMLDKIVPGLRYVSWWVMQSVHLIENAPGSTSIERKV